MKEEIPIECYVTREGNLVKFVRYEKIQELQEEIKRLKEEYMILQNASDEVEEEKDKEIERLKQGYCELKEKCNKGECDCTHEEYNNMCEENIKLDLEIERLNNIIKYTDSWIDRTIGIIKQQPSEDDTWILERLNGIKQCLKGVDKE